MATFVRHEPCPRCGSRDNLARYSDGSGWCFGCSRAQSPTVSGFVTKQKEEEDLPAIKLPHDLCKDFPQEVVEFIKPYNLTVAELLKHDYLWSSYNSSLWRKLPGELHDSELSWERRSVHSNILGQAGKSLQGGGRPKASFYGSKESCFPISKPENATHKHCLVLVEDSLSSLKVGRVCDSIPLFGVSISSTKINKLKQQFKYQRVVVWLDHDKFREGWEIANKFKWLGCGAKVVLTEKDPKFYSEQEIVEFIK